jgi:hypothetical protein
MDWDAAIEKNREALKRILAALVAMASLDPGGGSTLPRYLHTAVLRLLRPAESAVRRLVIVAARGVVVPPPRSPSRSRKANPAPTILRNGVGTGILMPPALPGTVYFFPRRGAAGSGLDRSGKKVTVPCAPLPALSPCRFSIGSRAGKPAPAAQSPTACRASRCRASPRGFPSCPAACQRPAIRSMPPVSACGSRHWPQPSTICRARQNASPAGGPAAMRSAHWKETMTPPRKAAISHKSAAGRIGTGASAPPMRSTKS